MPKSHRILNENTGNIWNMDGVFWPGIFRIFARRFQLLQVDGIHRKISGRNIASNCLVFFVASRPFLAVRHSPGKFSNIHQIIIREGRKEKETTLSNYFSDYFFPSKKRKEFFPVTVDFSKYSTTIYIRRKRCLLYS
jgi:hypothetical protein